MKKHLIISMMFLLTMLGAPFMTQGLAIGTNNQSSSTNTMKVLESSTNKVLSNIQGTKMNVGNANAVESTVRLQTSQTAPSYYFSNYNTTVNVNSSSYKPGQTAVINITAPGNSINGSISWALLSPLNEPFFSFSNDTTYSIFQDPYLIYGTSDWKNDPTYPFQTLVLNHYNSTANLLTLGSTLANSTKPDRVLLNDTILPGQYQITFQYNSSNTGLLDLSAWNGAVYNNYSIAANVGTISSSLFRLNISIGNPEPSASKYLGSQMYFSTNQNNTWDLTGFRMYHNLPKVNIYQPGNTTVVTNKTIQSYRSQGSEFKNNITITSYTFENLIKKTSFANFTIALPKYSLFLGDWQFALIVNPIRQSTGKLISGATIIYRIPLNITDQVIFNQNMIYMNRGFNTTTSLPIYAKENTISVYSPGDNITLLGSFAYTSTNMSFNSNYYGSIATNAYLLSNASQTNLKGLTWGKIGSIASSNVQAYNKNGKTVEQGNFTIAQVPNVNTTWGINYHIPLRGIYGNITNTLYLIFPNLLQFDLNATPSANQAYITSFNISTIVVKFKTNISAENLPFNRVYYLTELLQGSFNITTSLYNSSLATIYSKNNVSAILDIPRSDLTFNVFLAKNGTQQSVLNFIVSSYQSEFVYNQIITPNLDVRNNYSLHINWNDALSYGDVNQGQMKFITNNATSYPISIEGTFNIGLPTTIVQVQQGTNYIVNFTISIAQLQAPAKGLLTHGRVCLGNSTCSFNTSSNINIIEENGRFTAYYTIATNAPVGLYTLTIYSDYGVALGNIEFVVIPRSIPSQDIILIPPSLLVYLGSGLILLSLAIFLVVIFFKEKIPKF